MRMWFWLPCGPDFADWSFGLCAAIAYTRTGHAQTDSRVAAGYVSVDTARADYLT
jgi:hypothetical protein